MHRWLAHELDELQSCRGKKINVIGPRGGAKRGPARKCVCETPGVAVEVNRRYGVDVQDRSQAGEIVDKIGDDLAEMRVVGDTHNYAAAS